MYTLFCSFNNLLITRQSYNSVEVNGKIGCKNCLCQIVGHNAYGLFRHESGVHKVQRVPLTEKSGRVHSSTCQVAVLKETLQDFQDEEIDERDLKFEFMRAGGAGGQHVNKTDSACRVTHLPSKISVHISESRDQHANKARAVMILKERISSIKRNEFNDKVSSDRKSQVGMGNLSEKIRTYNWPDSRVTDHRLGVTLYGIDKMLEGEMLSEFVERLSLKDRQEKLHRLLDSF